VRFWEGLDRFSTAPALITPHETLSYAGLSEAVSKTASDITTGMPRPLVMLSAQNTVASVVAYLACLVANTPVMMVDAALNDDLKNTLIKTYHPNLLISTNGQVPVLDIISSTPTPTHPDLAVLLSTSGSTGSPKYVRLTAGNIAENATSIAQYLNLDQTERPITALPMHYSYGLSVINSHLSVGAALLLTPDTIMQKPFWDFANEQKMTSFSGVPYMYKMLKRLRFFEKDRPSLKTLTQAGGKLDEALAKEIARSAKAKGIDFYIMYGQTEATARISYVPTDHAEDKADTIGVAIPNGELNIEEGELVYRGPNVMMGYAETKDDLLLGDTCNGVLYTGDLGTQDTEGYFKIIGRKKRFIKLFGNRVNLDDVEKEVADRGIENAVTGQDDALVVIITDTTKESDIKTILKDVFKFHPSAISVKCVDEIPRTSSGKVKYAGL